MTPADAHFFYVILSAAKDLARQRVSRQHRHTVCNGIYSFDGGVSVFERPSLSRGADWRVCGWLARSVAYQYYWRLGENSAPHR
jgi:hypothetical protein